MQQVWSNREFLNPRWTLFRVGLSLLIWVYLSSKLCQLKLIYYIIFLFCAKVTAFLEVLYLCACPNIFYFLVNVLLSSYDCHTCLPSSVEFNFSLFLNVGIWLLYLALNSLPVISTYFSSFPSVSVVTAPWYTTLSGKHSPIKGHSVGHLQL